MKNNLKRVVITGSEGSIGKILKAGLKTDFDLYFIDKKADNNEKSFKIDIALEYDKLKSILRSKDAVVHLAWDNFEDFPNENIVASNKTMAENIFRAAQEVGLKKIIIASSVHANDYTGRKSFISIDEDVCPDGPYGASKIYIESLGKYYAKRYNQQIACIRFGGINKDDKPLFNEDPNYDKVLLYKNDYIDLIKNCLNRNDDSFYTVLYAISNHPKRIHDVTNIFQWNPRD